MVIDSWNPFRIHSNKQVKINQFFSLLLGVSILALALSFWTNLFLGIVPCFLCKLQRIPYFLIGANACLGIPLSLYNAVLLGGLFAGSLFETLLLRRKKALSTQN